MSISKIIKGRQNKELTVKSKARDRDKLRQYPDWIAYWKEKGLSKNKDQKIINGYEGKLSYLTDKAYKLLIDSIKKHLSLSRDDFLLDVGCGGGILTKSLKKFVNRIIGIDAAKEILQHMPKNIKTYVAKADNMPFSDKMLDKILCHSIFQYFPSLHYASLVTKELERVCKIGGLIYIVDLPNLEKKDEYEKHKKKEKHNLKRLFYTKDFFADIWPHAKIFDNRLRGYGNARYRFNVLVERGL